MNSLQIMIYFIKLLLRNDLFTVIYINIIFYLYVIYLFIAVLNFICIYFIDLYLKIILFNKLYAL